MKLLYRVAACTLCSVHLPFKRFSLNTLLSQHPSLSTPFSLNTHAGYLVGSCFDTQNGVMDAHFGGKGERGKQRGRYAISATRPHVGPPLVAAAHISMPANDELVAKLTSFQGTPRLASSLAALRGGGLCASEAMAPTLNVSAFVGQVDLQSTLSTTSVDRAHATAGTIIRTLSTLSSMVAGGGAASIRSVGDAISTRKGSRQCHQVEARHKEVGAHAWAKRMLPRAAVAAALVACGPGRARAGTLPTTLPTSTTSINYGSNGYTGAVSVSRFTFESCRTHLSSLCYRSGPPYI